MAAHSNYERGARMIKKILLLCLCFVSLLYVIPQKVFAEGVTSQVTGVLTKEETPSSSSSTEESTPPSESQKKAEDKKAKETALPSTGDQKSILLIVAGLILISLGLVWWVRKIKGERHD